MINFKEMFSQWLQSHREKCAAKRQAMVQRQANECVNVVEYNGTVYFAFHDVPLIPVDDLKGKVTELLPKYRATVITWADNTNHHVW